MSRGLEVVHSFGKFAHAVPLLYMREAHGLQGLKLGTSTLRKEKTMNKDDIVRVIELLGKENLTEDDLREARGLMSEADIKHVKELLTQRLSDCGDCGCYDEGVLRPGTYGRCKPCNEKYTRRMMKELGGVIEDYTFTLSIIDDNEEKCSTVLHILKRNEEDPMTRLLVGVFECPKSRESDNGRTRPYSVTTGKEENDG